MGVEFQSYVILKRLELEVSAWSRFVEFLKLFKMLMDLKWKICVVFSQSWKTKRPVFFFGHCYQFKILNAGSEFDPLSNPTEKNHLVLNCVQLYKFLWKTVWPSVTRC